MSNIYGIEATICGFNLKTDETSSLYCFLCIVLLYNNVIKLCGKRGIYHGRTRKNYPDFR